MGGLYINDNGTPKDIVNENPAFPYITDLIGSTDISDIGDGTVTGAIDDLNSNLSGKQDKLTNPLTQSDVKNNLTSTDTNKPLSAAQGKALNTSKANISAIATGKTYSTHAITFQWTNDSYLQIMVDNTVVCQFKGFKRYD